MRALVLSTLFAFAMGGQALAQAGNTMPLVDLPGMSPKETSPVQRLSKPARTWIEQERERQMAEPGDLVELAFEIETNIGPAILKVAERERIDTRDIIMAVMFEMMKTSSEELESKLRKAQAARAKGTLTPEQDVEIAGVIARKGEIDMRLAEVVKNQTMTSRALVAGL